MSQQNIEEPEISLEVGQRLRAVRRQRRWSLDDVERKSAGRWSASAVGAYERGYRNLSLPRLQELAQFYGVRMSLLLGEDDLDEAPSSRSRRLALDVSALERTPAAMPVLRFVHRVKAERGDHGAAIVSLRTEDVRALASALDQSDDELFGNLQKWGVLAHTAEPGKRRIDAANLVGGPVLDLRDRSDQSVPASHER